MAPKKTPVKKAVKKQEIPLYKKIDYKPILINPLVVFVYATLGFLTLEDTDLGKVDTWVKAGFIGLMALLSFVKNSLVETRKAIKG